MRECELCIIADGTPTFLDLDELPPAQLEAVKKAIPHATRVSIWQISEATYMIDKVTSGPELTRQLPFLLRKFPPRIQNAIRNILL